jgi:transporter family-2 protein
MTAHHAPAFATIMLLTGVGIPIMAALNGGLGTRLGSPMAASVILFGVATVIALAAAFVTGEAALRTPPAMPFYYYLGGAFVAFYVISVTFIAPRFGVGNAIFFVLLDQLVSAAVIDHFGLFGAVRFPINGARIAGLLLMVAGVYLARRTA